MIYRIYNVVDTTGRVVKIGSTIQSLNERKRGTPYNSKKYKNCKWVLKREFEWPDEDRVFGKILQYVREQFDISKNHLWDDEGGWNIVEPITCFLNGFEGSVGGRVSANSGHCARIAHLGGRKCKENKTGIFGLTHEQRVEIGCRVAKSGHCARIAHSGGYSNVINKTGFCGRSKKKMSEDGRKAGLVGGRKNVESGHIQRLGRQSRDSGLLRKNGLLYGRYAMHIRWHVNRGVTNLKCDFCVSEKSGRRRESTST